jgi:hypothetical protein
MKLQIQFLNVGGFSWILEAFQGGLRRNILHFGTKTIFNFNYKFCYYKNSKKIKKFKRSKKKYLLHFRAKTKFNFKLNFPIIKTARR